MADRTPLSPEIQRLADAFRGDGRGPHFASSECEPGCPACGYLAIYHDLLALQSRLDEAEKICRAASNLVWRQDPERDFEPVLADWHENEIPATRLRELLVKDFDRRRALAVSDGGGDEPEDWTRDEHGRSNNSRTYHQLVVEVAGLIRGSTGTIFTGNWPMGMARTIVSQLAHKHGLRPVVLNRKETE